jgi:2-hydroxychromene-2-carboxylate isomerase
MNPKFPFNSISLQRLLVAVGNDDRIRLIDALLPPIWEEKMDVSDLEAVGKVVQSAGFDAQHLFAQTQDPDVKQKLVDNTENAVERGVFGIPTFFVDGEMFFGKERLGQIEEEISA